MLRQSLETIQRLLMLRKTPKMSYFVECWCGLITGERKTNNFDNNDMPQESDPCPSIVL